MNRIPILSVIALLLCFALQPVHVSAQDNFPKPISETSEILEPGKAVFLSYPKYYRNAEDNLVPVDTTLQASSDAEWDYEVTTGIWQLKVKTDGTFQAQHEGDTFTYRFQNLGIGRGNQFRGVDLGEPDFSNYQVNDDTIRWTNVFADVDLTLRYINDIMKVDVIVKQAFMDDLRTEVNTGSLSPDEFLTARFAIPNVFITSQAKQGGQPRDLYGAPVDLGNRPLYFERDGKVVHKLRPVESYVLDDQGKRIDSGVNNSIQTAQRWQLQQGGGGFAEMSANIGDLANAPEGDVVIDPSTTFDNPSRDTLIYQGQSSPQGSNSTVSWTVDGSEDERLLFAFHFNSVDVLSSIITNAKLRIWETWALDVTNPPKARAHKITTTWSESTAEWDTPWTNNGGDFVEDGFYSEPVTLPKSQDGDWMEFDVTQALRSHLYDSAEDGVVQREYVTTRGFMLKGDTSETGVYTVAMDEYGTSSKRPQLVVNYQFTGFGVDAGAGYDEADNGSVTNRISNACQDNFAEYRMFIHPAGAGQAPLNATEVDINQIDEFEAAGKEVVINFGIGPKETHNVSKEEYARLVEHRLDAYESAFELDSDVFGDTIVGVEFGNEEAKAGWHPPTEPDPGIWYLGSYEGGQEYAKYYLEAYDQIKNKSYFNKIEIANSMSRNQSRGWGWFESSGQGSHVAFAKGFIDQVTANGGFEKLPDVTPLHNYSWYSPEYREETDVNADRKEWFDRIEEVLDIFNERDYSPLISQMEYGYSPNEGRDHAPADDDQGNPTASETAHAVYYLRSVLMTGTIQAAGSIRGLGWLRHLYFHHPNDYINGDNLDYGFYGYDPSQEGVGNRRKISHAAALLHSATRELQFDRLGTTSPGSSTTIWKPIDRVKPDNSQNEPGHAWCSWETSAGQKWGAIWRYKWQKPYFDENETTKDFIVSGDITSNFTNVELYKFDFTSSVPDTLVLQNTVQSSQWNYNSTKSQTEIPINTVDEEPTFLKFN